MKSIIKFVLGQKIINSINLKIYSSNLNKLALIYNTDKFEKHFYTPLYMGYFNNIRKKKLKILEIGVGGYENPSEGGASLKMWKKYFINSQIYAIDIYDKSKLEESRIKIFKGSQIDSLFLDEVIKKTGTIDIVIDDGSHMNTHVISSFNYLFTKLNKNGIYVIEDTQTSYWDNMEGDSKNLSNPKTTMNFFKKLLDAVNHDEFDHNLFEYKKHLHSIKAIHFYHNIIFVFKN